MVSEAPRTNHNSFPPRRRKPRKGFILLPTLFYIALMLAVCSFALYYVESNYGAYL